MPQKDPSRTEQATPKRREKAREEGNVPRSDEVSKVATLLVGVLALRLFVGYIGFQVENIFDWSFDQSASFELTRNNLHKLLSFCLTKLGLILLPVMAALAVISFLSVRLQVGQLFTAKVFQPKMDKFNPVTGIKNQILSLQSVVNVLRSVFQMGAIALVATVFVLAKMDEFLPLFHQHVKGIVASLLQMSFELVLCLIIPMLIIAVVHFFYTRWDYEENLKMTKQEVEDEHKQSYGNPELKQEQRKRMQGASQGRMSQEVPKADVIVTNPVRLAVALRYDPVEYPAPVVLAKGAGRVAEKIREIAEEHKVPIRENKPLAQALYKEVEVGEVIPEELYQAVASILAGLDSFRKRYQ